VPDLEVDRELAEWLTSQGHPRGPSSPRSWRDAGLFEPRAAPGAGRGRRRSTLSEDDRRVALALAEALDSRPGQVGLDEAAMAAWGSEARAPIYDPGLREALVRDLARQLALGLRTLKLAKGGSRKATAAIVAAVPGYTLDTVRGLAQVALGERVPTSLPAAMAEGAGLTDLLTTTGALVTRPHDPTGGAQAMPGLHKLFEGPATIGVLIDLARTARRVDLDAARDEAQALRAALVSCGLWPDGEHEGAPGWGVAFWALALLAMPEPLRGSFRRLASEPAPFGLVRPSTAHKRPRGRPIEHHGRTTKALRGASPPSLDGG
jgi:hypothetical protein